MSLSEPSLQTFVTEKSYGTGFDDKRFWRITSTRNREIIDDVPEGNFIPSDQSWNEDTSDTTSNTQPSASSIALNSDINDENAAQTKEMKIGALFRCPVLHCQAAFLRNKNLLRHQMVGRHTRILSHSSLKEKVLRSYSAKFDINYHPKKNFFLNVVKNSIQKGDQTRSLPRGWAVKQKVRRIRMNSSVKDHLNNYFNEARSKNRRIDAQHALNRLRAETENGMPKFLERDLPRTQTIAGYFGRLKKATAKCNYNISCPEFYELPTVIFQVQLHVVLTASML